MIISDLIDAVSYAFCVEKADILGTTRYKHIIKARFALYMVLHSRGMSLKQTGKVCGGRDHATVIHGIAQCKEMMARDPEYKSLIERLTSLKAYRVTLLTEDGDGTRSLHTV